MCLGPRVNPRSVCRKGDRHILLPRHCKTSQSPTVLEILHRNRRGCSFVSHVWQEMRPPPHRLQCLGSLGEAVVFASSSAGTVFLVLLLRMPVLPEWRANHDFVEKRPARCSPNGLRRRLANTAAATVPRSRSATRSTISITRPGPTTSPSTRPGNTSAIASRNRLGSSRSRSIVSARAPGRSRRYRRRWSWGRGAIAAGSGRCCCCRCRLS